MIDIKLCYWNIIIEFVGQNFIAPVAVSATLL